MRTIKYQASTPYSFRGTAFSRFSRIDEVYLVPRKLVYIGIDLSTVGVWSFEALSLSLGSPRKFSASKITR